MKNFAQVAALIMIPMFSVNSHAITLSYSDLPDQIQADLLPAYTGITSLNSMIDASYMNVFMVNNGGQINWLIRYSLDSASSRLTTNDNYDGTSTSYTAPYAGYMWLEAPMSLNLTGENYFRVYTDQVTPNPDLDGYNSGVNQSTWVFGMNASTAIAGSASVFIPYDQGYGDPVSPVGNLNVVDGFITCIECEYAVSLNLAGLLYDASGKGVINTADQTALLLSYNDYDTYSVTNSVRNFYVQPVPVPAAVWLFGSGLITLFGFAGGRKKH